MIRSEGLVTDARVIVVAVAFSIFAGAAIARAETAACRQGISRETTERLFALLNHPLAEADCRFEGVSTQRTVLEARWSRSGAVLPAVRVVPRECAPEPSASSGAFVVDVPPEIEQSCPSVVPVIGAFLQQVSQESPAGKLGSSNDPLFRAARALFAGIVLVSVALLIRAATRRGSFDPRWVVLGAATFSAALLVRAGLPFTLGNWYSEVLSAAGPPPWMRFGPGSFAFQSLLRDAGLWNTRTLVLSQVLIGAAALPLLLGALRELRVGFEAAAATLVLFVFAPFHACISATTSEHVLASTLCLALLLCWLRAARTGDALWFAAAVLLFPAVCLTRVDMTVQALAVLPWPLLSDRVERSAPARISANGGGREGAQPRPPRWMIVALGAVALITVCVAYQWIALPSQHPMPEMGWFVFALRWFLPQFWLMAINDPPWISLSSVLLAVVGALAMAARRPLLFVRVAGTLVIAFVVSGRSFMHDELVGSRYFLFTIPVFLIASGFGFEAVLGLAPRRLRPAVAAAGMAGLALWTGLAARPAYAARYAFQDEYAFARRALAQLPAGCTVYQVLIRADVLPHDVDCCLDVARSPLVLEFPELRFLDLPDRPTSMLAESQCVAYYEGVACEIAPGRPDRLGHEFAAQAAAYFGPRCAEARRLGRLELVAQTSTSPRTTMGFFDSNRPHARLYRWAP